MNTTKNYTKAAFYITNYIEDIGRALVVAAVDFYKPGLWITEAYVLFTQKEMSTGIRVVTTYNPSEIPSEWLPTADSELENRLKFCDCLLFQQIRKKDKEIAIWAKQIGELLNGPLTPHGIAQAHLSGEFQEQILDLLGFTECTALKDLLTPMSKLPLLRRKIENQNA